jgi:predicted extracellular nuclease
MRTRPSAWSVALCAAAFALPLTAQGQVVISQIYGGGGNTGAPYRNDFIELFNAGSTPVNLAGMSVQYASSSGSSWSVTPITSGMLQPGQ